MAFAVPVFSALSAGASLLGGLQQASALNAQGEYQAAIAANNETLAIQNAKRAEADARTATRNASKLGLTAQIDAQDQDLEARKQLDTIGADFAISGVTGSSQSKTLSALEALAGRDRSRIIASGQTESEKARAQAQGFRQEAADLRSGANAAAVDAQVSKSNASSAASGALLTGIGGALEGGIRVGGMLLDNTTNQTYVNSFNNLFRRRTTA